MKNKNPKTRLILIFVLATFLFSVGMFSFTAVKSARAASLTELRRKSAELQEQIDAANEQADELADKAETLEEAVAKLNGQIANAEKKIRLTNQKIDNLGEELIAAEKELERQKVLLEANMTALYKRRGASEVELLVASDSFSQFIDEQEYLERLKTGIQESAEKVIQLKQDIQAKKEEQENLKQDLERQRGILANSRAQQKRLLDQTRGEEAKYQSLVNKLEAEQAKAEAAMAAALASGSFKTSPVGPVSAGDIVGAIGNTGLSSGPHLHLEVRVNGATVDPAPYIRHPAVTSSYITQTYGNPNGLYPSGYHTGIDYSAGNGAIHAIDSGYLYRGCSDELLGTGNNAYGYVAIVQHSSGHVSVYAHMSGGPAACDYNTYY